MNENVVLFSGYAKLPAGTASSEMYKVMGLVLLIDVKKEIIVEADCTLSTPTSERFVATLLVGSSLKNGIEEIVERIEEVYQGTAKKAILAALRLIYDRYSSFMNSRKTENNNQNKEEKV